MKLVANLTLFSKDTYSCKMEPTFNIYYYFFIHSEYKILFRISLHRLSFASLFPDSTLCGNAELRDNNQVQVALVIYLCLARE